MTTNEDELILKERNQIKWKYILKTIHKNNQTTLVFSIITTQ